MSAPDPAAILRDAKAAAADGDARPSDGVFVCGVCNVARAKYTCPRCSRRYCALECYKTHDARCVDGFHGENFANALRGLTVEDE